MLSVFIPFIQVPCTCLVSKGFKEVLSIINGMAFVNKARSVNDPLNAWGVYLSFERASFIRVCNYREAFINFFFLINQCDKTKITIWAHGKYVKQCIELIILVNTDILPCIKNVLHHTLHFTLYTSHFTPQHTTSHHIK